MNPVAKLIAPTEVSGVIGQPVQELAAMLNRPETSAWMLVGDPGTGKTLTSQLAARQLGCTDEWSGLHHYACSSFGIEEAKELFNRKLRLHSMSETGFHCVILEECEWLSQQVQRFLKNALDPATDFNGKVVVIGTTNSTLNLDEALLERFVTLQFQSGEAFKKECMASIRELATLTGVKIDYKTIGMVGNRFSMRTAISQLKRECDKLLT